MSRQHKDSFTSAKWQGEVDHETAATNRLTVRTDSVFNTAGIHLAYPSFALRSSAQRRRTGICCCNGLRIR